MSVVGIVISVYSLSVALAHKGHNYGHPFIDKRSASSVLKSSVNCSANPQSVCCTDITYETWCEEPSSRDFCREVNESGREEQCQPNPCSSGQTCYLSLPCKAHYETGCNSSNPCLAFPCYNDGTCVHTGTNAFYCNCKSGYDASSNCLTDIDECASDPCLNGGSCTDHVNFFTCDCSDRYNGTACEKDCRPGPVDLLFLVDSSTSSMEDCRRMKDFMSSIVNQLAIGPDDFQIAASTYSFSPTLEWTFSQYSDNETMLQAIDAINCTGGATYTGKALEFAIEVFSDPRNGGRNNSAFKQVILITDGLSTDRRSAIQLSWSVNANGIKLYVVGLGNYVDHRELHQLVHDPRYVFSATDNQLLLTIFRETAHPDCNDCHEDSLTDVVLLLDSSSSERIKLSTKAAIETVKYLDVDNTDIRVGIMSYADVTSRILPIEKHTGNDLSSSITKITLRKSSETNMSRAIESGKTELDNSGGTNSKRLLILYTSGNGNNAMESKLLIRKAVNEGTNVLLFGIGEDADHGVIRSVVTDSFYSLLSASTDDHSPLKTVKSESWHTTCAENIFRIRI